MLNHPIKAIYLCRLFSKRKVEHPTERHGNDLASNRDWKKELAQFSHVKTLACSPQALGWGCSSSRRPSPFLSINWIWIQVNLGSFLLRTDLNVTFLWTNFPKLCWWGDQKCVWPAIPDQHGDRCTIPEKKIMWNSCYLMSCSCTVIETGQETQPDSH